MPHLSHTMPGLCQHTPWIRFPLRAVLLSHIICYLTLPMGAPFTLTVVHTNDVHARFEEFSKFGSDCRPRDKAAGACYGGVARRVTALRDLRRAHPNLLLLDAGDQFQGTLWFFVHKGRAASHFMNRLNYDAMALGNHEFDNGVAGVLPFLDNVTFPVLSANIDASLEPSVQGRYHPSVVLEVGGEKVGVIGYTTTDTPDLSHSENLIFEDEVAAIRREAERLQQLGVNKIIALGHAGFKTDLAIAKEVEGVDLVVGGHTNTFLYTGPAPAHETPVGTYPEVVNRTSGTFALAVQDFAFGKYLGVLHVTFDDDGAVTGWSGNPQLLDNNVEQDAETLEEMATWRQPLQESFGRVLGRSHVLLEGTRAACRLRECNLGNFVTDAMVAWHLKFPDEAYWANVSLAIHNGGGIRSSISPGNITLKDAYNVHPFANTIDLVELQGRHLREVFEHSVKDYDPVLQRGRFLQVSGIHVIYDITRPNGQRVVDLLLRCSECTVPRFEPIDNAATYKLVLPSFLAAGGDGYDVIPRNMKRHHVYGDVDIDLLIKHVQAQSPVTAGIEGRIEFISTEYCHRPGCGDVARVMSAGHRTQNQASLKFLLFSTLLLLSIINYTNI